MSFSEDLPLDEIVLEELLFLDDADVENYVSMLVAEVFHNLC
jgi:hypothetical protein